MRLWQRAPAGRPAGVLATASLITVGFAGSVLVTPLYPLYQRKFGFSEVTLTLIYAIYVIGNVAALLVFGQVSDQFGRKKVALPALGVAALGTLLFLFARGTGWLYLARLLIGLSTGMLSGTATAWLAEQYGHDPQLERGSSPVCGGDWSCVAMAAELTGKRRYRSR